jgi:hypothetical protein
LLSNRGVFVAGTGCHSFFCVTVCFRMGGLPRPGCWAESEQKTWSVVITIHKGFKDRMVCCMMIVSLLGLLWLFAKYQTRSLRQSCIRFPFLDGKSDSIGCKASNKEGYDKWNAAHNPCSANWKIQTCW